MSINLIYSCALFLVLHVFVWFSSNAQFISDSWNQKSFYIMLGASLPISLCAYYASRLGYSELGDSAWGVRFLAFGTSYLIFPVLTWLVLKESMFTPKTMICIGLSFLIICIQVFWKS